MTRIPLLADARIVVADTAAEDIILRPAQARTQLEDVGAAVRDALAFPLGGRPLDQLVTRGGTATSVIEQPSLPIPGVQFGPRHEAIAAVSDELDRLGVEQVTILVAGGLLRRTAPREIGLSCRPSWTGFRGRVIVHDAEADDLTDLGRAETACASASARRDRSRDHRHRCRDRVARRPGGAARSERARVAARGRCALAVETAPRRAGGSRSRSSADSQGEPWSPAFRWRWALAPGPFAGYRRDEQAVERLLDSRVRHLFQLAPSACGSGFSTGCHAN